MAKHFTRVKKEDGSYGDGFIDDYSFQAVVGGSPENDKFFAYTPSIQFKLSSVNIDLFEPGKEYYLDFTPVS